MSLPTFCSTVERRGVHPQVSTTVNFYSVSRTNFSSRSLIAAYIGNIVGALFVGLPAVYCYLNDYHPTDSALKDLENGSGAASTDESKDNSVQNVFPVDDKRA